MKKLSLFFCLLFSAGILCAAENINYAFLDSLLDSLYAIDQGIFFEVRMSDGPTVMLASLHKQNKRFENALLTMKNYAATNEALVRMISGEIAECIDDLIFSNNTLIDIVQKYDPTDPQTKQRIANTLKEANKYRSESLQRIFVSATWTLPLITDEETKTKKPRKNIPFKISHSEQMTLAAKIGQLFGEQLQEYHRFLELTRKGNPQNPGESVYIIGSIDRILDYLTTTTYKERRQREAFY